MRNQMFIGESSSSNKRKQPMPCTSKRIGNVSSPLHTTLLDGAPKATQCFVESFCDVNYEASVDEIQPTLSSFGLPIARELSDPFSTFQGLTGGICGVNHEASVDEIQTALPFGGLPITRGLLDPFSVLYGEALQIQINRPAYNAFHHVDNIPRVPNVLLIAVSCKFCKAERFYNEPPGFCCGNGQVRLVIHPTPAAIWDLFTNNNLESLNFKKIVRPYNNMFAFTSFGVRYDAELTKKYKGISTFKAQGQIYHYMNALLPCDRPPRNLQLYFYDTEHEVHNRLQIYDQLDPNLIVSLLNVLETNPYSQFFRSLINVVNLEECQIILRANTSLDQRVFNAPSSSQVAAIWVENDDSVNSSSRDIIVYSKSGSPLRIQYYFGCYDPLQYPLLFPLGESGWHQGIPKTKNIRVGPGTHLPPFMNFSTISHLIATEANVMSEGKKCRDAVSCREYYCYKLQMRPDCKCVLLHSSRLLQQFCVDMYVKLESSRLDFFRLHQSQIRSELYSGILDSINVGERRGCAIGKRIILPASFIGGPRDMRRRYLDAMTLVQRYGKPDIFLTMTCNPSWPEITEHLLPGEESQNRPDLIARVFRAKFHDLKNDILKNDLFGYVVAHVYVIEFQKRGLPHAHMLLILAENDRIRTNDQIDLFVSAEIPEQSVNPHLYHAVWKHMLHGPCGLLNPFNSCMTKSATCKNSFPKQFRSNTTQTEGSYPLYKRSVNKSTVVVRGQALDNRWVIPYNPYLLAKFDCHINVEICASMKAVKYVYKYIYKGHDQISFQLSSTNSDDIVDEISCFQNARWVGPPEAMWRIYEFLLNQISPSVMPLQLHLENNQSISFHDSSDLQNVIDYSLCKRTTLTEYFHMNAIEPVARTFLYREFPEHFVWHSRNKEWQIRKRNFSVGRIVSVNPIEGDRYYLRLLLNNIKGATSFKDLRTFNGVLCESFRDSSLVHGLIEVDSCYRTCLNEACAYEMPKSLRKLFSTLLVFCNPPNAQSLWKEFMTYFSEDFIHSGVSHVVAYKFALNDIASQLESMGKNINDYKLIDEYFDVDDITYGNKEINDELTITTPPGDIEAVSLLNPAQRPKDVPLTQFLTVSYREVMVLSL